MAVFVIAHLYPDLMNLYGDRGNLICLQKRLEWLGHTCRIKNIGLNDNWDFQEIDMIFMGGGSDREQNLVYSDLREKKEVFWQEIEQGFPVLCICGAFQFLGTYYLTGTGIKMDGLSYFAYHTVGGPRRLIGNIAVCVHHEDQDYMVVGFENHGGYTYFDDPSLSPWGKVVKGYGNNGEDGGEGILYRNLIGSYLHGPLLPKNPFIADFFIKVMAKRRGVEIKGRLENQLEDFTRQQVLKNIMGLREHKT